MRPSLILLLGFLSAGATGTQADTPPAPAPIEPRETILLEHLTFDTLIHDNGRLEFYHLADFSGDRYACAPCLQPHHVNCPESCYLTASNLTLICTHKVMGLSLGPFDRANRQRTLNDLLLTDQVIVATAEGETALLGTRISSQSAFADAADSFSIEVEGFRMFKRALEQATTPDLESFQIRIGPHLISLPLSAAHRTLFNAFLRQCPEG